MIFGQLKTTLSVPIALKACVIDCSGRGDQCGYEPLKLPHGFSILYNKINIEYFQIVSICKRHKTLFMGRLLYQPRKLLTSWAALIVWMQPVRCSFLTTELQELSPITAVIIMNKSNVNAAHRVVNAV